MLSIDHGLSEHSPFTNFIALLNDDALLASTNAFIPFIIPPIAAMPWIIANASIALLFLVLPPDVTRPCSMVFNLFGKSAGKV